jgi:hypothetical protein
LPPPLFSDVADVRQHLLAEQFERFDQLVRIIRARCLERQYADDQPALGQYSEEMAASRLNKAQVEGVTVGSHGAVKSVTRHGRHPPTPQPRENS